MRVDKMTWRLSRRPLANHPDEGSRRVCLCQWEKWRGGCQELDLQKNDESTIASDRRRRSRPILNLVVRAAFAASTGESTHS